MKIYIGQHKGCDLPQYLRSKWYAAHHRLADRSQLYAAMRHYPRSAWSIHPLVSRIETRAEVDALERHFIRVLKTQHPDVGYNICRGGEGFTGPHTAEALQKMDQKRKKYWQNTEHHKKRREASQGMWANPEFHQKMSSIQKQATNSGRFKIGQTPSPLAGAKGPNETSFKKGNRPWNTGTKGIKKANSGSFQKGHHLNQGRKFSDAHRAALSLAHMQIKTL